MLETFESLKKKGKVDSAALAKLGLSVEIKEDPKAENETPAADI